MTLTLVTSAVLLIAVALRSRPRRPTRAGLSRSSPDEPAGTKPSVASRFLRGRLEQLSVSRRRAATERELPAFLESLARSVRAGLSVETGARDVLATTAEPLRSDVDALLRRIEMGMPLEEALIRWKSETPSTGVDLAVSALSIGADAGGQRARAIEAVVMTLRERLALGAEVRSLSTQARASAVVMGVTPVFFLILATVADAKAAGFLIGSRFGFACLLGGLALETVGALWMLAMTRSAL